MKVSITHAERRCAQHIALDVFSLSAAWEPPLALPAKLLPTQRCDFTLARGAWVCVVAFAISKVHGPAPLLIELEAEEGETLTVDTVRMFVLDPSQIRRYTADELDEGKLARVLASITYAGDRQQYGVTAVDITPARDVLVAIVNGERAQRCGP